MVGEIYDFDKWLRMLEAKENRELSEGARWWLSRIAAKQNLN